MIIPPTPTPPPLVRIEGLDAIQAWKEGWRSGYAAALRHKPRTTEEADSE